MGFAVRFYHVRGIMFFLIYIKYLKFKENTGMEPFPKDEQGNRLYSDVHYVETYKVHITQLF